MKLKPRLIFVKSPFEKCWLNNSARKFSEMLFSNKYALCKYQATFYIIVTTITHVRTNACTNIPTQICPKTTSHETPIAPKDLPWSCLYAKFCITLKFILAGNLNNLIGWLYCNIIIVIGLISHSHGNAKCPKSPYPVLCATYIPMLFCVWSANIGFAYNMPGNKKKAQKQIFFMF